MDKSTKPKSTPAVKGDRTYLQHRRVNWSSVIAAMLACTAGVFLLLPFTQMIASYGKQRPDLFSIEVALPPPPPPPPDLDIPDPPEEEPPPPEMQQQVQPLSLSQMDVALNLGTGDGMAGAFAFDGFGMDSSDTAGDLQIFDVRDLDRVPRMVQQGQFVYPADLRRARVSGFVELVVIIDENGNVRVDQVSQGRIREFVESATRFAETSRFEPPMKNGQPVRARYTLPVRFSL
ncbi:MAG: energy transducer TonB [Verrucomicrobia bacterium]|nr:energy transducer TonB [Verrucomicrobiota bacterium]